MIFAELHGKLGEGYTRADERREDVLTSTAFGLLRYLPFNLGIGALLRRARVVTEAEGVLICEPGSEWLRLRPPPGLNLEFWPRLAQGGEPDLRLTFKAEAAGSGPEVVLIEVKLYSGKSPLSRGGEDMEVADERDDDARLFDSDQLAGYLRRQEAEMPADGRASIVYLTAHCVPPREQLQASLRPRMRLAWLSWTDVWLVADAARNEYAAAADLADLLHHKGFSEFSGFQGKTLDDQIELAVDGTFWIGPTVVYRTAGSFFAGVPMAETIGWLDARASFFKTSTEGSR